MRHQEGVEVQRVARYRTSAGEIAVELPRLCAMLAKQFRNPMMTIDADALAWVATGQVFEDLDPDVIDEIDGRWLLANPDVAMLSLLYQLAVVTPEVWVNNAPND